AQVVGGRRPDALLASSAQPLPEREPGGHGPWPTVRLAQAKHVGVHRVPDHVLARILLTAGRPTGARFGAYRCPGAVRIEPGPDELAGAFPARRPAPPQRRIGERRDEDGSERVHQPPPEREPGGGVIIKPGVHANLD